MAKGDGKATAMVDGKAFTRLVEHQSQSEAARILGVGSGRISQLLGREDGQIPLYMELASQSALAALEPKDEAKAEAKPNGNLPALHQAPAIMLVRVPAGKADAARTVLEALGADIAALPDA